ncbi:6-phosphogluconolactonase, partial [Anaerorhabdus sp.]|uniref:6-phosphogluconolactonase n=2 Tax=Anaerorhabdus sp. TaxID=1872524 RepID=UPI002FCA16C1
MNFIIVKDKKELSEVMADVMLKHMISQKNRVNISITTGKTPIDGYSILASKIKNKSCFDNVHYYIFDEFWYKDDPVGICRASLDKEFFNLANIKESNIHNLTNDNYLNFDNELKNDGGLDMVIMGIGENGHFCGNQPGTFDNWNQGVHLIDRYRTKVVIDLLVHLLHEDLHSDDQSRIPDNYITMGPKTIMQAKSIVFILSSKNKAEVAKKAFYDPITEDFPVSIFQLHRDVTIIIDED